MLLLPSDQHHIDPRWKPDRIALEIYRQPTQPQQQQQQQPDPPAPTGQNPADPSGQDSPTVPFATAPGQSQLREPNQQTHSPRTPPDEDTARYHHGDLPPKSQRHQPIDDDSRQDPPLTAAGRADGHDFDRNTKADNEQQTTRPSHPPYPSPESATGKAAGLSARRLVDSLHLTTAPASTPPSSPSPAVPAHFPPPFTGSLQSNNSAPFASSRDIADNIGTIDQSSLPGSDRSSSPRRIPTTLEDWFLDPLPQYTSPCLGVSISVAAPLLACARCELIGGPRAVPFPFLSECALEVVTLPRRLGSPIDLDRAYVAASRPLDMSGKSTSAEMRLDEFLSVGRYTVVFKGRLITPAPAVAGPAASTGPIIRQVVFKMSRPAAFDPDYGQDWTGVRGMDSSNLCSRDAVDEMLNEAEVYCKLGQASAACGPGFEGEGDAQVGRVDLGMPGYYGMFVARFPQLGGWAYAQATVFQIMEYCGEPLLDAGKEGGELDERTITA